METGPRVCLFCGDPPGDGVFCASCGRNLAALERLPTRAEWEAEHAAAVQDAGDALAAEVPAERCAAAVAAFLEAMHAAGDPGAAKTPMAGRASWGRTPTVRGWVLRPVDREDFEEPRRYTPGLFLTVEGELRRLDSELRGWGQRDFPHYHHTVGAEAVPTPTDARLIADLDALLHAAPQSSALRNASSRPGRRNA